MNREVLVSFSVEQLQRFQSISKERVHDMRKLMVQLQGENKRLGIQYEQLVKRKKEVHDQLRQEEGGLMKIYSEGKKKMSDIMGIFKKEGRAYQPRANQQPIIQEKTSLQQKREQSPQRKVITGDNFQFDDIYILSKEKVQKIVKVGGQKIHQISQTIKQKYNSLSKNSQPSKGEQNEISHFSALQGKPVQQAEPSGDKHHT